VGADDKWIGRDSGPVVRPYAVTGGRTEPAHGEALDLIAIVVAAPATSASGLTADSGLSPEHRRIVSMCWHPVTVADVAAETTLPIGVVRVLLADLIQHDMIRVLPQRPANEQPSTDLLREVLHGLRAL
jgi:hypothetical protein